MVTTRRPCQRGDIELWALGGVAALVGIGVAWAWGYTSGADSERTKAQAEASRTTIRHLQALGEANRREALLEQTMHARLAARDQAHAEEMSLVQKERDRFAAAVRRGDVRLSIPVVVASCGAAAGADPGAAPVDRHEARAELAPETALDLVAIADAGDDAIRQLNQCIDAYADARSTFNAAGAALGATALTDAQTR